MPRIFFDFDVSTAAGRRELARFERALEGVGNSAQKTANKTQASLAGVQKQFASFQKNLLKVSAAVVIAQQVGRLGGALVKAGMDAQETANLFDVALGDMAKDTRRWVAQTAKALRLNKTETEKNVGVIFQMTSAMGISREKALEMAKGVAVLSQDMASFFNLDPVEAFRKIQSGLTGQSRPLKDIGIVIDDLTIKQAAYRLGIAKTGTKLTEQQKVLARYAALLEQTSNAQGDLARTADQAANSARGLDNAWENLKSELGVSLLPAVTAANMALVDLLDGMAHLAGRMAEEGFGATFLREMRQVFLQKVSPQLNAIMETAGENAGQVFLVLFAESITDRVPGVFLEPLVREISKVSPDLAAFFAIAGKGSGKAFAAQFLGVVKEEFSDIPEAIPISMLAVPSSVLASIAGAKEKQDQWLFGVKLTAEEYRKLQDQVWEINDAIESNVLAAHELEAIERRRAVELERELATRNKIIQAIRDRNDLELAGGVPGLPAPDLRREEHPPSRLPGMISPPRTRDAEPAFPLPPGLTPDQIPEQIGKLGEALAPKVEIIQELFGVLGDSAGFAFHQMAIGIARGGKGALDALKSTFASLLSAMGAHLIGQGISEIALGTAPPPFGPRPELVAHGTKLLAIGGGLAVGGAFAAGIGGGGGGGGADPGQVDPFSGLSRAPEDFSATTFQNNPVSSVNPGRSNSLGALATVVARLESKISSMPAHSVMTRAARQRQQLIPSRAFGENPA